MSKTNDLALILAIDRAIEANIGREDYKSSKLSEAIRVYLYDCNDIGVEIVQTVFTHFQSKEELLNYITPLVEQDEYVYTKCQLVRNHVRHNHDKSVILRITLKQYRNIN